MTIIKKILKILISACIIVAINITKSKATIHTNDSKITAGENVQITITSTEALQNYDIDVVDNGGLKFVSVSTLGAHNGTKISGASLNGEKNLATYTFKSPDNAGTYKVTFIINKETKISTIIVTEPEKKEDNNTIIDNTTSTTNATTTQTPATNTSTTTNKTVEEKPVEIKKSSNANISALWLTPKEYDFTGSKASVLTYNTKVPYEVEEITIGGRTQDSKAKFTSGIGKQKLQVGNNSVKVEVTAEDGSKKTYTINITREEKKAEDENKIEDTNTITEEVNTTKLENTVDINKEADLLKLEVKGFKFTPEFSPNIYEYKMNVDNTIDSLDVITEKKDNNVSVEIVGNTALKEGENVITVLVHNNNTNKNYTYQIIVDKLSEMDLNGLNENLNKETQTANNNRKIIFGLGIGIIILFIIFIIVKSLSSYNEEEEEEEDEEDDDDEQENDDDNDEKINLEEDEKLFKRINKKEKSEIEEEVVSSPKQRKKGKHF